MATSSQPEYWLRGPVPEVPPLLQPVAHALLQARYEVQTLMQDFEDRLLWEKPAGVASVGFHLQHLSGVLDRLFTYAKGQSLSPEQLQRLKGEGKEEGTGTTSKELIHAFEEQVEKAIAQLRITAESTLTETRRVGRAGLPATVLGLLVHAAEHTMRHTGQLLVTVKVVSLPLKY
ncbi:MAG TPA: DinB family protein [Niastella sp.]|nr:DinB family protein [Niastella sp.]